MDILGDVAEVSICTIFRKDIVRYDFLFGENMVSVRVWQFDEILNIQNPVFLSSDFRENYVHGQDWRGADRRINRLSRRYDRVATLARESLRRIRACV
ncbi:hypothetical protein E2553_35080 [Paraburkholderia dipogonis]|uniref:Uncharacterized protein n=1 Tax=Paraburkholderia dipogonis TaxID=1211383 RepID=A0A4Y8MWF0_9BURK|nr:hypothetical protein [Paraburkholderia dipogonis]TFE41866.1 hypothetical protein E2553_35080 [Paraburkholderia dipogonis]